MKIWKIALLSTPIAIAIIGLIALIGVTTGKKNKKMYSVTCANEIAGVKTTGFGEYVVNSNVTLTASLDGYDINFFIEDEKVGTNTYTFKIEKNTTVRLEKQLITYTIDYDLPVGAVNGNNPLTYNIESDTFELEDASYEGYTFNGWLLNNQPVTKIEKGTFGNLTLKGDFDITTYKVSVKNEIEGITINGLGRYIEGEIVTLTADGIKPGNFFTWIIDDKVVEAGSSLVLTIENKDIDVYIDLIKYDFLYFKTDNNIYFGSYPQTKVNNEELVKDLNNLVPFNAESWNDYNYYIEGNVASFMYYKDIDINNDGLNDYRGVYFSQYRPQDTDDVSSAEKSYQDNWGYNPNNVYWFSYDPIKWNIVTSTDDKALIMASLNIDSQEFYSSKSFDEFEHNGGVGYANNYELSNIRKWLNDNFYNTAFNDLQKKLIITTLVKNDIEQVYLGSNDIEAYKAKHEKFQHYENIEDYVGNDTLDNIFLFSFRDWWDYYDPNNTGTIYGQKVRTLATDYAKAQGVEIEQSATLKAATWLRSPGFQANYANNTGEGGGLIYGSDNTPHRRYVADTHCGIRPVLWINLDGSTYNKITITNSNTEFGKTNITGEIGAVSGYALTLMATPNLGYSFAGWFSENENLSMDSIYTFYVTKDITIEARWVVNQYMLDIKNMTPDYDFDYDHGGQYDYKEEVTIHFYPHDGYKAELYDEENHLLELDNNTYTFSMPNIDIEYSVYFVLKNYRIIYELPFGTVNPNPTTHTIEDGEITLLEPTVPSEFTFNGWYIDDEEVTKIPGHVAKDIYVEGSFETHAYNVTIINNTNGYQIVGGGIHQYDELVKVAFIDNDGNKIENKAMAIELETLDKNNQKVVRMFNREEYEFYMPNHDITLTIMDMDDPNYYNGESPEENRNFAGDEILYFGTYPQALVKDRNVKASLIELAGKKPTETGATNWTDYGFYEQDEVKSYMWYKDITLNGSKYRAVYFTEYRPGHLDWKFSQAEADPDRTFNKDEMYFFKFEPIAWKKSVKDNSNLYAALLCLDAQSYVTDSDPYHTGYESSYLRSFLSNTFYETAFNDIEKDLLEDVSSGDKVSIFEYDKGVYDYNDNVWDHLDGTEYLKSEATDYALCLRPKSKGIGYDVEGRGTYFLKIAYGDSAHARTIHDVMNDDLAGSSHKKTVLCIRPIIKLDVTNLYSVFMHVNDTNGGTVTGENTYNKDSHVTIKATPKDGYAFIEWIDNKTGNTLSSNPTYEFDIDKNYSVTAKFLQKYYITYENVEGADNTVNPEYYTTETSYVSLFYPSKEGYAFEEWTKDGIHIHQIDTSLKTNITVRANWNVKEYSISYIVPDDTTNPNPTTYTIESDDIIFKGVGEVTNPKYVFVKWVDENDADITSIEKGSTGNRTIKGIFNPAKFEVIIHNQTNGLELSTEGGQFDYNSEVEVSLVNDNEHVLYFNASTEGNTLSIKRVGTSIKFIMPDETVNIFVTQMANNSFKEVDTTSKNIENDAYFGSYPQTLVEDESLNTTLTALVGATPTKVDDVWNENDWIDYGFYANGTVQKYMWYKDVTYAGEKYRAVYFTNHRPSNIYDDFSSDMISDYDINTIYFFKFEPVKWMKCGTAYMDHIKYDVYTTYAVLDEYQYLNDQTVSYPYYGRNSELRSFVTGNLFNLLFDNCNTDNLGICYSSVYDDVLDIITIFSGSSTVKDYLKDTDYMKIPASDYSSCLRPLKNGEKYSIKYEGGGSYWLIGQTPEEHSGVIVLDNATTTFTNTLEAYTIEGIRPVIYVKRDIYTVETTKNKEAGGTVTQTYSYYRDNNATVVAQASDGYRFVGWEKEGSIVSTDETYTFKVIGSVALKALFATEYTITYEGTRGVNNPNPDIYTDFDNFDLENLSNIHGYDFTGWTLNGNPISKIDKLEGNITLVANWTKANFTVTLTPDIEGLVVSGTGEHEYQSTVTLEVTTPIIGYDIIFKLGDEVLGTNTGSFIIEDNTVITLVKSPIDYDINYTLNGGTNGSNPISYNIETPTITLYDATKNYYDFVGWYTTSYFDADTKITEIEIGSTGEINLFAKFTPISYNITYPNCIGEDITNTNPIKYTYEDTIVLVPAYKTYYDFIGWTYEEDSTDYIVNSTIPAETIHGPIELYAHWTPKQYDVVYNNMVNVENDPRNPQYITVENSEYTLYAPGNRLGYLFDGWFADSDFNTQITEIPAHQTKVFYVYAKWVNLEYAINYNEIDGLTITHEKNAFIKNDYIELSISGLELGYYVKTTINGTVYNTLNVEGVIDIRVTDSVLETADENRVINFTLEKVEIDYEVTYNDCENATHSNPATIKASQFPYTLAPASREGYVFIRWEYFNRVITQLDDTCINNYLYMPIYAIWGHNATYKYIDAYGEEQDVPAIENSNPLTFAEKDRIDLNPLRDDLAYDYYYVFDGWYLNDEKVTSIPYKTTTDVTLVGHFIEKSYPIVVVNNTGLTDEELAITGPTSASWNGTFKLVSGYTLPEGKTFEWVKVGSESSIQRGEFCDFSMEYATVTVKVSLVDVTESN